MSVDGEYDYDEYEGECQCPNCMGTCDVPCYCAGDFCICDNHGYEACPTCHGEGHVTELRYDRYMENQRKNAEMMREIMERATS